MKNPIFAQEQLKQETIATHSLLFKVEFESLKKQFPKKAKKVKENFLREVFLESLDRCLETIAEIQHDYDSKGIAVRFIDLWSMHSSFEIIRYAFHTHYFNVADLEDGERAELQRNASYREMLISAVKRIFIADITGVKKVVPATKYDPEIYACEIFVDNLIRVIHGLGEFSLEGDELIRYKVLCSLLSSALLQMKNILLQLTGSLPSEAVSSWRSLFEVEYKLLVLIDYDATLAAVYKDFGDFAPVDGELSEKDEERLREYASEYGYKSPCAPCFKNYGWILAIQDQGELQPSLKQLVSLATGESTDAEPRRYAEYRIACLLSHSNGKYAGEKLNEGNIYHFVQQNLSLSADNVFNAFINFSHQYSVPIDDEMRAVIESSYKAYKKTVKIALERMKQQRDC